MVGFERIFRRKISITTDSNRTLDNVSTPTLLGLDIDSSLSFDSYIEKVCKKLPSWIAILRKLRGYLPLRQRALYYNAIIRPAMEYGNVIWPSCDKESLNRVLKLQKRAARTILYADHQASSVALFNNLCWIPFYEQCKIDKCSITYKRIHSTVAKLPSRTFYY